MLSKVSSFNLVDYDPVRFSKVERLYQRYEHQSKQIVGTNCEKFTQYADWYLNVLDAMLLGSPGQQLVEFCLGWPDDFILQHLYKPVD